MNREFPSSIFLYPLNTQDYNDFPTHQITHSSGFFKAYSNFKELTALEPEIKPNNQTLKCIIIIVMKRQGRGMKTFVRFLNPSSRYITFQVFVFQIGAKCAGVSISSNWDKSEVCLCQHAFDAATQSYRHYNAYEGPVRLWLALGFLQIPDTPCGEAPPRIITWVINFSEASRTTFSAILDMA